MSRNLVVMVRIIAVVLGVVFLASITCQLIHGHITYSIGEVATEQVTTRTIGEALSIWVAFAFLFLAIILAGAAPQMYVKIPWLWKAFLSLIFCGYLLGSILR